jgi:lysophospholipase L1-like esterase
VAVGASETVGYGTPRPEEQAWPQVFARTALPPGTSVVNLGISGATVGEALAREVPEAVAARPDVVTVWLNVNDLVAAVAPATYEGELGQLVHALRDGGRTTVLVANTPALDRLPAYLACRPNPPPSSPPCLVGRDQLPSPAVVDLAVDAYNRAVAAVAAREGAVLVDLHAALDAARQAGREADLVGPDGFHPSVAGHEMVAAAFAAAYRSRLSTSSSAVAPRT